MWVARSMKTILLALLIVLTSFDSLGSFLRSCVYQLETALIQHRVMAYVADYHMLTTSTCTLYYTDADTENAPLVLDTVALYLPSLAQDFSANTKKTPIIVLYPNEQNMKNILHMTNQPTPMGAYYGGMIHILSPTLWAGNDQANIIDRFLEEGPIVHELSHYFLDQQTNGRHDVWFTEGVALYYEYKYIGVPWRPDLASGTLLTPQQLNRNFATMDVATAYRRAFELVCFFVQKQGEQMLFSQFHQGYYSNSALYCVASKGTAQCQQLTK